VFSRLRSFWRARRDRAALERDTRDELRFHIDSRAADLLRRGVSAEEARRQARLEFGNPAAYSEQCRDARRLRLLDDFIADVRLALRGFRQQKLLAAIVVATLTFGIGVSSGVFTIFSTIALRAQIDADPGSFLRVFPRSSTDGIQRGVFGAQASVEEYLAFRDGLHGVRALAAHSRFSAALNDEAAPARINLVTCNFFDVFGPDRAALGRLLLPSDCDGDASVIVLSHSEWRTGFGADGGIVGRTISVSRTPLTVVGVAPPTASTLGLGVAWVPFTMRARLRLGDDPRRLIDGHYGHERWLSIAGRLAPGATRDSVGAELAVVAARQDRLHPGRTSSAIVTDGAMVHDPASRGAVLSIVGLVMTALSSLVLIACANVATLLLSRAEARQQEVAVRLSLGAGRSRVLRMLLAETLTLAACAGVASLYVAYRLPVALATWLLGKTPELPFVPDWHVFVYLGTTVWIAGIAAGLAPAVESMRVDVLEALKGRRSMMSSALSGARFRAVLVAVQVALSFMLLVGAALFLVTHYHTITREVGMETAHVLMPQVLDRSQIQTAPARSPEAMQEALLRVPGVRAIVFADTAPVFGSSKLDLATDGWPAVTVRANTVSPGFFAALDIAILQGRALDEADRACGQSCRIVVSNTFARRILRTANPIGTIVQTAAGAQLEIVGVARDTTVQRIDVPDPPQVYLPWTNDGRPYQALVRFSGRPGQVGPAVSTALRERFPGTVVEVHTLRWPIESWLEDVGKIEALIVALAGTGAALAAMGVFGVVSFSVSRRRRELGVRLALGAARSDIYTAVMGGALAPVVAGLAAGVGLALSMGAIFARLLFELHFSVSSHDPVLYAAAGAVLAVIVTAALVVPARRAASINPLVALRYE